MNVGRFLRLLIIVTLFNTYMLIPADGLEPVTTSIAIGAAGLLSSAVLFGYDKLKCQYYECCDSVTPNFPVLERSLRTRLYGQHLVIDTVIKALKGHVNQKNPTKALVLSFHGWTGNGKNFVSRLIAESMYENGMANRFVHLYIATLHFPHNSRVQEYQDNLRKDIIEKVKLCERSLFIFDEMDKMPPGILDALTPFLDYHVNVDGVDFRKAMFILLSNTAGHRINELTFQNWKDGNKREAITLKKMEEHINRASFNIEGGLWHSRLIEKNLISAFLPFLPMEYRHVKMCARADLLSKNFTVSDDILEKVASQLQYFPMNYDVFSTTGCKRVPQKVDYIMEELEED